MSSYRNDLLKAAAIARISLSEAEISRLLPEIEDALSVFGKIDSFKENVEEEVPLPHKLREDKAEKSTVDVFSNSKFVKNGKFIAPKLVD